MAIASPDIFAPAKLLDDDFFGSELVDDFADDLGSFDIGGTDCRGSPFCRDQQHSGKDELVAGLAWSTIDPNSVSLTDPELMAAVLKNCVHPEKLLASMAICLL
jgi:hypothetical protein